MWIYIAHCHKVSNAHKPSGHFCRTLWSESRVALNAAFVLRGRKVTADAQRSPERLRAWNINFWLGMDMAMAEWMNKTTQLVSNYTGKTTLSEFLVLFVSDASVNRFRRQ